jgi:hypothetical protein
VPLLQKFGLNITALLEEIEREIAKFHPAGATAEPTLSRERRVFDRAENEAKSAMPTSRPSLLWRW